MADRLKQKRDRARAGRSVALRRWRIRPEEAYRNFRPALADPANAGGARDGKSCTRIARRANPASATGRTPDGAKGWNCRQRNRMNAATQRTSHFISGASL